MKRDISDSFFFIVIYLVFLFDILAFRNAKSGIALPNQISRFESLDTSGFTSS